MAKRTPTKPVDRSAERAAENKVASDALAKELAKGYYWQVSLPGQPVVCVDCKGEEDAIELYNKWARINGSDMAHQTEKVPAKGPRLYDNKGEILYGTSGQKGRTGVALPPAVKEQKPAEV